MDKLSMKLKKFPDKVKRREVIKILRRAARDTVKEARAEAPVSKKAHVMRGTKYSPGNLRKSIGVQVARKSREPMIFVRPKSSGKFDGWYGRAFVIPGHKTRGKGKKVAPDPFMDRAVAKTEGKVSNEALKGMEKYIQKLIDRL